MMISEYTAEQLVGWLEKRQYEHRIAEIDHARAKAKFEATCAVLAEARRHWDDKPLAGNVKDLIKNDPKFIDAHSDYLSMFTSYQIAKDAEKRITKLFDLWQTLQANARRV